MGAFLAVALLPALVCGGVAGERLASGVFGVSGASVIGISTFIVLGIVASVSAVGSLFAAVGAVAGASIGVLTRAGALRKA
jgi:hypothetical protein